MTRLEDLYFNWLCHFIDPHISFQKLIRYLFYIDFEWVVPMDANRADDGIDLRYQFASENRYSHPMVASDLDTRPCSILEMLIALAIRMENIMDDPEIGNRTSLWFWDMIRTLKLDTMDNLHFNVDYINRVLSDFLERRYSSNGEGGLFITNDTDFDMRNEEIWYQMQKYLNGIGE